MLHSRFEHHLLNTYHQVRGSVRKGIQLKSDVLISEMFENAPAQLFMAGHPSYRQYIGKKGCKTLTQVRGMNWKKMKVNLLRNSNLCVFLEKIGI